LWYFKSALPRALHVAYPLAVLGALVDRRVRPAFLVAMAYVALYSNLGHKEVRFLFPVLPLWNLSAAAAVSWLQRRRAQSIVWRLVWLAFIAALLAGVGTTVVSVAASKSNYPGGTALRLLHQLGDKRHAQDALHKGKNVTVHIDVLPAMTGVTRFGERGAPWVYSKQEGLSSSQKQKAGFEYLLSDSPRIPGFTLIGSADGFIRLKTPRLFFGGLQDHLWNLKNGQLPLQIDTAPVVFIHERISTLRRVSL
jgi:alpha-1,6-mannosyltransferase